MFAINSFALPQWKCYNLHVYFRLIWKTPIFEMFSLIQKNAFEKCCTQTKRNIIIWHKKRCSAESLNCPSCTNFSTQSRAGIIYHIAKKHFRATARVAHKCKKCDKDIHSFYNLPKHKRKEHEAQRISGAQNVDVAHVMEDVFDYHLKEEMETCKHFSVDSDMENGRHRVYNFAMDTLDPKQLLEKLHVFFDSLKCQATFNVALGFVPKNVEDESCRSYYAHENKTPLERSKLVAATEYLTKAKNLLSITEFIESCTRERAQAKWKVSSWRILQVLQHYSKKFSCASKTM